MPLLSQLSLRLAQRESPKKAMTQTEDANTAETFQPACWPTTSRDGRLTIGPANNTAAPAPSGAPAARSEKANGISKKLGSARGTAKSATRAIATTPPPVDANVCVSTRLGIN